MNSDAVFPMAFGIPTFDGDSAQFSLANETIHVNAPEELIRDILSVCDGQTSFEKVIDQLQTKWNKESLRGFIVHLMETGVLYDSRAISQYVWSFVSNPTRFTRLISDAEANELAQQSRARQRSRVPKMVHTVTLSPSQWNLARRNSCRCFSGEAVDLENIVKMLWSTYGVIPSSQKDTGFSRHTIPSAGALYPLEISLVILRGTDGLSQGLYRVIFLEDGSVGLTKTVDSLVTLQQSFADPLVLSGASGVIVISGSFVAIEQKYANRALLYVPLEAGHAAQNLHLIAQELQVATVEIGGFLEGALQRALGHSKDLVPLTTIIFGRAGKEEDGVEPSFEVRWMNEVNSQYKLPFNMVMVRFSDALGSSDWSCGRDEEANLAYVKATAEAREWAACGTPTDIVHASIGELVSAIPPGELIAFHPQQYQEEGFPLHQFEKDRIYSWRKGIDVVSSQERYVLADCVYYPYYPDNPFYTSANSSGSAAYPTREGAIERGVLELVERDAFMIVWLNQLRVPTIRKESVPGSIQQRINALQEAGLTVVVKDLSLDLAPVIMVFVQHQEMCFTTCAASSGFDMSEVLDHALKEVESSVYCFFVFGPGGPMRPEAVSMTHDHGALYEQEGFYQKADFFQNSDVLVDLGEVGMRACKSEGALLERLQGQGRNILVVDLDGLEANKRNSGLYIVKTFVTGLVPMSFGYLEEPCGMQRIYEVPVTLGFRAEPILYDELNRFPHPYT